MELKLVSPIPPSVNHYMAYRVIKRNDKPTAMSYKTQISINYKSSFCEYVKAEAIKQGWSSSSNPYQHYYVEGSFYFPRTNMDCNNYWKVMLDAITDTGIVWPDDNVVCERVKRIQYDSQNPRIELTIYPTEYVGIFDNAQQLEQFEAGCADCIRHEKNCSILNKAIQGRIQPEINNMICSKHKTRGKKGKK